MEKKYYKEINIARGIAVLLVLLGHSFPDAQTGFHYNWAKWIFDFVYSFHMAVFIFLAGFVMGGKYISGDYDLWSEIIKKVKRLLVPYFVYTVLTIILKLFMNDYANNPMKLSNLWKIFLGKNPNGGLWYLWTLFVISVIVLVVGKLLGFANERMKVYVIIIFGLISYFCHWKFSLSYFDSVFKFMFFYCTGIFMCNRYNALRNKLFNIIVSVVFFVVLVMLAKMVNTVNVPYLLSGCLGIYVIMTVSLLLVRQNNERLFDLLGTYSYEIYLLSYFVQVSIRVVLWTIIKIPYGIVVGLMFVCGAIIPYLLSKYILKKNTLLKRLFIGDWK